MQTRSSSRLVSNSSSNPTPSTNPNPKGRNRRRSNQRIKEFNLEELSPPIVMMADQHTMAQLLQVPTEGYEDAIVVPAITTDNFELKHGLLTLVQNKQFFGHDKEDPHAHILYFNKITSTLKFLNVPNTSIKLMLFPFSLEGAARIWLEKEPSRSIFTWDDLVSKFINQLFPPSKTTNLRNEITNFQQCFDESFSEAWDIFKDLLRAFPHHAIIESKSKVRYSCNKPVVAKVSMNTSTSGISPDVAELKDMMKALLLDKKSQNQALADLGASINLMPLSVWKRLSLPELTPTCMTLEFADRSISQPIGVAEDVYVKVEKFHFLGDFVVVDFDADTRVPLILGRSFLKTRRALINVIEVELTFRVGKEAITFNLDQTSRYSANYNDMTANRIDVIDMAYE
nr:reverse transcriptase domain-containing protein [Tanacetum cinerariifolium]